MRRGILISSLALALIALVGCGSSKSSSSSSAAAASSTASTGTTTTTSKGAKVKKALSHTYAVKLTGPAEKPPGPSGATGKAVVTVSTKTNKVCWTFKSLSGFNSPTFAHIHVGAAGTSGNIVVPLSTGTTLKSKGCVSASPATISAIAANPHGYYVNIHSKQYPSGAVRAQL
jgi:hypothetical protein